jgi:hypothetical protein
MQKEIQELTELCNSQQNVLDHVNSSLISQYQDMYSRLDALVHQVTSGKHPKADFFDLVMEDEEFIQLNQQINKANREHVKVQTVYFCNYKKLRALENMVLSQTIQQLRRERPANL